MQHTRLLFPEVRKVKWEYFDLPDKPDPYDFITMAHCSLVSVGTELALYTGTHIGFTLPNPPFPMMPQRPGYAFVGEVVAVGSAVETVRVGQRVMLEAPHGTAAVMDSRTDRMVILPKELDNPDGTLIRMADIALTTLRVAPIQLGDAVVIYGLGLVGQLVAQLYRLNGATPIIGIDLLSNRLDIAKANGILALNPAEIDIKDEVTRLTDGRGPDVVVEATGSPGVIPLALDLVTKGGKVALLGSTRGQVEIDVYSQIHRKGVHLIGAHESVINLDPTARRWKKTRDLTLLANLFADGKLTSQGLITHNILPRELPDIYAVLAENPEEYLGVLVDWQS
jgi:2-desacetyl-2-hydroxyethyl bacteriochlorophyllide A dehydrogenase